MSKRKNPLYKDSYTEMPEDERDKALYGDSKCWRCHGSGTAVDRNNGDKIKCPRCGGTGRV